MSTHFDGPAGPALHYARTSTRPPPSGRSVVAWTVLWTLVGAGTSVPAALQFGAAGVLNLGLLVLHLVITLPVAMAVALLAAGGILAAVVGVIGLAARIVRPRGRTGAAVLCTEILRRSSILLPGYIYAWRRSRSAAARGGAVAFALVLAVVAVAAGLGALPAVPAG